MTVIQKDYQKPAGGLFGALGADATLTDLTFDNIAFTLQSGTRVTSPAFGVLAGTIAAEATLTELEDKTGLLKRFMQMRGRITAIEEAAAAIKKINYRLYENAELAQLADEIGENAAALKE